jgi:hypothetical protein
MKEYGGLRELHTVDGGFVAACPRNLCTSESSTCARPLCSFLSVPIESIYPYEEGDA